MPSRLAVAVVVTMTITMGAQAPQPGQPAPGQPVRPPARDRQVAKGTAIIRGQVVDAASGAPVRRARVMVFAGQTPVAAQTDAEGRFELQEVPAGKHTLNVSKTGYLSLYATNNNKPIPPLDVKDRDVIERVVLRLSRGGVISGQVVDEFGDPFVGGEVRAMKYRYVNGQRQLTSNSLGGPTFTDDLGAFRLYGLEPGDYYIVVRGGRDYMPFNAGAIGEGPAQTYYPGTNTVSEARRVTVRAGRETQGVVFPIALARLSRVRGRVVTSAGEAFTGSVSVIQRDAGGGTSSFGSSVRPDGTFEVSNLQPGTYTLLARQNDFSGGGDGESGRAVVTVNGEEINDVFIATSRGGTVRGRIVTDDGSPASAVGDAFTVTAQPIDGGIPFMGRMPSKVNSDGTFEVGNLFDRFHLRPGFTGRMPATTSGPLWTLKAVLVEGQDATDTGIDIRPGQVLENIEIVYTQKASRLTGQLKNSRGEPATGWVVVFSSDESKWTPQSRFVRVSRPGSDGQYRATLVPHDDYLIVGVDGIEDGQWQDPEFLRAVKDVAARLAIGENESKVHDVTVIDWRR